MNAVCIALASATDAVESDMDLKLYLLIMLIGALLAAVRLTSATDQRSETLPR